MPSFLQILEVREAVLERIFKVRKEEVKICPDQNIRQEEMLNTIRFGQAVLQKLILTAVLYQLI